MIYDTEEILDKLIHNISTFVEVQSIGISGCKSMLPQAGEGDIDIFIYCDSIPEPGKRQTATKQLSGLLEEGKLNVFEGGHWGTGDFVLVNGVETWLMYFTLDETLNEVESILNGDYPDKVDNYYYPVGRCAMLKNINILYDRNDFLGLLKVRLSKYPEKLMKKLLVYHLGELDDTEDLQRAVTRKDVLFYHFALDISIDHFLQALFAVNKVFFPSRKRSLDFIKDFSVKPEKCSERLLEIVRLGSYPEGILQSYELWSNMANELKVLCKV